MTDNKNSYIDKEKRLVSIQLLRCISCIMVFMIHLGQRVQLTGLIRNITDIGARGPILFFLISGFLSSYSLCKKTISIKKYYIKRISVILPLYYSVILYFFISETILEYFKISHIPIDDYHIGWFRYIFLLNGFINSNCEFWRNLGMTLTIPIFAFFYLIAPIFQKIINNHIKAFVV